MSKETAVVAVDSQFADIAARNYGHPHFKLRKYLVGQRARPEYDVLEAVATSVQMPVDEANASAAGEAAIAFRRKRDALEAAGARVLVAPAKRTREGGLKHSDDATLMIAALSCCVRLQAKWLFLVCADSDFAPLVWELRSLGVRTEVFGTVDSMAPELRRAAHRVTYLETWFQETAPAQKRAPAPLHLVAAEEVRSAALAMN